MSKIDFSKIREKFFSKKAYESAERVISKVTEKSGFLEFKECKICGSNNYIKESNKLGISINLCNNCGVSFSNSYPKNFDDLYSDEDYLNSSINAYDASREYRINRFGKERIKILKKYHKTGQLLDVGCGTGWFLEEALKTYQCTGVEYSDSLRGWLKTNLNIDAIKTIELSTKKYELITAFDLIEHVIDPRATLLQMKNQLKNDGIILIYTPNKDSFAFNFLGEKNNLICPPQHLYYFNEKSFLKMAQSVGLQCVLHETKGTDIEDIKSYFESWLDKNYEFHGSLQTQKFIDSIGYANHSRYILKHD